MLHSNVPGYRTLLSGGLGGGMILPRMRGIIPGKDYIFTDKHSSKFWGLSPFLSPDLELIKWIVFARTGCDIIGNVSMFPSETYIHVADPTAIKVCVTSHYLAASVWNLFRYLF